MEGKTPAEAEEGARLAAMTATECERAEYIKGLRMLADVLDKHPEVQLPVAGAMRDGQPALFYFDGSPGGLAAMAAARKAFPCAWSKSFSGGGEYTDWLNLTGELAGVQIQLYTYRDAVCERVVTGTEDREVEEIVQPAVTRKVTRPVEIVEWVCHPVLAGEGPVAA